MNAKAGGNSAAKSERLATYAEFWPHYLREHSKPVTRAWHYFGTSMAIACIVAAIVSANAWWLLAAAVCGYGPAWIGHLFVEKNRPATFQYPFWSLFSDFRMYAAWLNGRIGRELERANAARQLA